jgi:D-3-phosphoglycerate dehydrogenase
MKVFVSTHPFSATSGEPMRLVKEHGLELRLNRFGRKITTDELAEEIGDAEVLVAGTEKITQKVFENAPNLKLISRVGIGLDGIDFDLCKKYGVRVAYTPDAPTMAVAELCVGLILDLARKISETNDNLKRRGIWKRHMGMLLYGKTVGIIGMGRIGKSLIHLLAPFNVRFLVHDIEPDLAFARLYRAETVDKETLLRESDIVSINIPLTEATKDYITKKELRTMPSHALLVNTARGGIVNEADLYEALKEGVIAGAAIDVFEKEPYDGPLKELENCILTCHMGASTVDSRTDMEVQAVEEVIRFKNGLPLKNEVYDHA